MSETLQAPDRAVGNARTHHETRKRLRRSLEKRGLDPVEIAAAVEELRLAQGERRVVAQRAKRECPSARSSKHAWRYGNGKRRCRNCGAEETAKEPTHGARIRERLRRRDGDHCMICGGDFTEEDPATIDHVKPRVEGGSNSIGNLRLAHESCNWERGRDQDPHVDGRTGKPHSPGAEVTNNTGGPNGLQRGT